MTHASIEDDAIVIRVELSALPQVVEGQWAANYSETRFKVTNPSVFAEELCRTLNRESEDGTTRVHLMFDAAILEAIEQGAEGIEEHEEQDA